MLKLNEKIALYEQKAETNDFCRFALEELKTVKQDLLSELDEFMSNIQMNKTYPPDINDFAWQALSAVRKMIEND